MRLIRVNPPTRSHIGVLDVVNTGCFLHLSLKESFLWISHILERRRGWFLITLYNRLIVEIKGLSLLSTTTYIILNDGVDDGHFE